ncbi:MurR/RpiR family transcriptional regulator [Desulfospira joergensenii]|uniref:MurR/RpiR family transcriptional regulator n=1 Tax=Desulfospira joergensenii TaxID=53329 RepID=UPI0003B56230|nr:SIS domain-containing protein [Desulfospira joergensenii]
MIAIDLNALNPLEKQIHEQMILHSKTMPAIRISQAAEFCQCSVSKISKFVKKLGFRNYRQYLDFLYGKEIRPIDVSDELNRVGSFIKTFDTTMVDELLSLIDGHDKIVLFGYGPSLLCAQYFEYRFRNCSDKTFMAVSDEVTLGNMTDKSTLLLIITETGRFHSFQDVYAAAKQREGKVVILVEEYNTDLFNQCDKIFWLSPSPQPAHLKPYEKSRTLFFIFLEEIVQKLLQRKGIHVNEDF